MYTSTQHTGCHFPPPPAQCDLPPGKGNGIGWLSDRLRGRLPEVGVVELRDKDVVRSPLVKKLVPLVGDPS